MGNMYLRGIPDISKFVPVALTTLTNTTKQMNSKLSCLTAALANRIIPVSPPASPFLTLRYFSEIEFPLKLAGALVISLVAIKVLGSLIKPSKSIQQLGSFNENLKKAENGDSVALDKIRPSLLHTLSFENQQQAFNILVGKLPSDRNGELLNQMALMHYYGCGTPVDLKLAELYLQKSADKGYTRAMINLSLFYEKDLNGPEKILENLYRAAGLNDRSAMEDLLMRFRDGRGVPADPQKEAFWRQKIVNYTP